MSKKLSKLKSLVILNLDQAESKQVIPISSEVARLYIGADNNEGLPSGEGETNNSCSNSNCSSGWNKDCQNSNCQTTNTTLENVGCTNTGCC